MANRKKNEQTSMSVKLRILAPMIITAILVATAILASNIALFSNHVDLEVEQKLDEAVLEMRNEVKMLQSGSLIAARYFAGDRIIAEAAAKKDHAALLERSGKLCGEIGIELCAVIDLDGKVLSRINSPDVYGDDLSGQPCVRSALAGETATGVERGVTVKIAVDTGTPLYDAQGRQIGAILTGSRLDKDRFVDKLKGLTGCEHTVFTDLTRVATTLVDANGVRAVGTLAPETARGHGIGRETAGSEGEGGKAIEYINEFGMEMRVKYVTLTDCDGNVSGSLYAGRYLTQRTDTIRAFIFSGAIITVLLLVFCVLLILFIAGRLSLPIVNMLDNVYLDGLTGINNRRYFDENVKKLISLLSRSGGALSLLMIDIDYFKKYNDTYGHSEGDACLKKVAEALSKSVIRSDDFVARYGGEEFVVVLPNTDDNGARIMSERLLESVRNCCIPHINSDVADRVTVSIGAATGRVNHLQSGADYVVRADEMLYKSKQSGRNRYSYAHL